METLARLLIHVLFHYRNEGDYRLHAFVVMRDHFHALLAIEGKGTIEGAVGRIKGSFSYRAKRELGFTKEIWQPGFTDERVWDAEQFCAVRTYIHNNPVRKGMVMNAEDYPFSSAHPQYRKPRGLKPGF
jgi:putative transposase